MGALPPGGEEPMPPRRVLPTALIQLPPRDVHDAQAHSAAAIPTDPAGPNDPPSSEASPAAEAAPAKPTKKMPWENKEAEGTKTQPVDERPFLYIGKDEVETPAVPVEDPTPKILDSVTWALIRSERFQLERDHPLLRLHLMRTKRVFEP
ncbi:hypothetical protein GJ744_011105 [Endocarpon pusillum]|uniref:Uncharacterized protein n=1 Tax=Endocarpon pusillum TaxID=364733 RepID=A0A8H7AGF8_9EURO|nr:hypothetical protein GJ744_011105 [Endocarpon pusillum]